MLRHLFQVSGDSLVYGGIAKNLLLYGRYALTTGAGITYDTLIRLPGYPLFLALCFRIFGIENYFAVACVQIVAELFGCALLAIFAGQIAHRLRPEDTGFGRRAGLATLWLAALCPFTASYAVRSLAEALTLFSLALAMFAMGKFNDQPCWRYALTFTFAVTFATLLRPDGALAAVAFAPVMLSRLKHSGAQRLQMISVCLLLALAPFAIWAARNWNIFHVFQPLAPRLAQDPDERLNPGWERWIRSWCIGFPCTAEVYWQVPGDTLDMNALPPGAFDSEEQYLETAALVRDYNQRGKTLTADLDERFGRIADERIDAHPLKYRLWIPMRRMMVMWFRPRNENLPVAFEWWDYQKHPGQTIFAWFYTALNGGYLILALTGLWLRPRFWLALLSYFFLRSCLLLTVQAPEARYTLECFPMLFALGGVGLAAMVTPITESRSATPNLQPESKP
jgi:hypothetical protein